MKLQQKLLCLINHASFYITTASNIYHNYCDGYSICSSAVSLDICHHSNTWNVISAPPQSNKFQAIQYQIKRAVRPFLYYRFGIIGFAIKPDPIPPIPLTGCINPVFNILESVGFGISIPNAACTDNPNSLCPGCSAKFLAITF